MPMMDRPAPPHVEPVTIGGTRFEQALDVDDSGGGDSGWLRAVDASEDRELWLVRVYAPEYDPTMERDVQEVYFTDLAVSPDGDRLLVTNEAGERWEVDPATGQSRRVE